MTCGTCAHFWAGEKRPYTRRAGHCLFPLPLPTLPAAYTRNPNGQPKQLRELKAERVGPSSCEGCPTWESADELMAELSMGLPGCPSCQQPSPLLVTEASGARAVRCLGCGLTSAWALSIHGLPQGEAMRQAARNWKVLVERLQFKAQLALEVQA